MLFRSTSYQCRDCGHVVVFTKPASRCQRCGSIYLLPCGVRPGNGYRKTGVTLGERLVCFVLGSMLGFLTFLFWGIAILAKGGPVAGKSAAGAMYLGLRFALVLSLFFGLVGFIWGGERQARLFGILWGTDREFNERFNSVELRIPKWLACLVLLFAIVTSYGYLIAMYVGP